MRRIVTAIALAILAAGPVLAQAPTPAAAVDPQAILHVLDYVAVDYPGAVKDGKVTDQSEYEEQVEFVAQARAMIDRLPPRPVTPSLTSQADQLVALVKDKRSADDVAARARELRQAILDAYGVEVSPRRPPDLRAAATLYASQCALCHGAEGRGDGPAGKALDPQPASFHDRERLAQQSVYGLYSTITLGVEKTGMASFRSLSETERWGLAFYVSGLGAPAADVARGAALWKSGAGKALTARAIASLSEREVRERHGEDATKVLAYLRARPEMVADAEPPLELSVRLLRESAEAYRSGRAQAAYDLAAASYLEGFELIEPVLDTVDRRLRGTVEAEMLRYRGMLRSGASIAAVESQARAIAALLDEARERLAGGEPTAGRRVHRGARHPAPGGHRGDPDRGRDHRAPRQGRPARRAALHPRGLDRRARPRRRHVGGRLLRADALRGHARGHRGRDRPRRRRGAPLRRLLDARQGLRYPLARLPRAPARRRADRADDVGARPRLVPRGVPRGVRDRAVRRGALATRGAHRRARGARGLRRAAAAVLGAIAWLVTLGGLRLPLGLFFGATSGLLALLAVIYAGQGVAALQAAGLLPLSPVGAPSLPVLGLYPNVQGLLLQAALLVLIAAGFVYTHRSARRAA